MGCVPFEKSTSIWFGSSTKFVNYAKPRLLGAQNGWPRQLTLKLIRLYSKKPPRISVGPVLVRAATWPVRHLGMWLRANHRSAHNKPAGAAARSPSLGFYTEKVQRWSIMTLNPIIAVPLNLELLHVCDALCITHDWPKCTSGTSRVMLMTIRGLRGLETLVSVCVCDTMGPAVGHGGPSSHAGHRCERHIRSSGILQRTLNNQAVPSEGTSTRGCVYRCDSAVARLAVRHRDPGADILSRFCLETINIHYAEFHWGAQAARDIY